MADRAACDLIRRLADSLSENCTDYIVNPQFYPEVAEARAYLAAHPEPAAGPTRRQVMMLAADMELSDLDGATRFALEVLRRWGHQDTP